ncbi:hypothetical protein GCM10009734_17090 [Nonomuraea bangladeshensis]
MGPTTQVMPGSKRRAVAEAKDLNPRRVRVFRYKSTTPFSLTRTFGKAYWSWPPGAGGTGWDKGK